MHENLFNHIDINLENVNIPKGNLPLSEIHTFCSDYETKIDKYGGLDI
jgi:glucosamine-6-phosphate deaminase